MVPLQGGKLKLIRKLPCADVRTSALAFDARMHMQFARYRGQACAT
jgi:hypothetical protein